VERVIESTLETLAARTTSYSHLHSVAEGMPFNRNDCVCMYIYIYICLYACVNVCACMCYLSGHVSRARSSPAE